MDTDHFEVEKLILRLFLDETRESPIEIKNSAHFVYCAINDLK